MRMWKETRSGLDALISSIYSADVHGYDTSSRVLRVMLSEKVWGEKNKWNLGTGDERRMQEKACCGA